MHWRQSTQPTAHILTNADSRVGQVEVQQYIDDVDQRVARGLDPNTTMAFVEDVTRRVTCGK